MIATALTAATSVWRYRKAVGVALGAAALAGALLWYRHSLIQTGYANGVAATTARWEADTAARDAATAKAVTDNAIKEAADRRRNEEIENDYQARLIAAAADTDRYFRLLQQARGQVRGSAAREATGALIASTAGEASIAERIDRATAGLITESRANADQLDALIAVVKPRVDP